MHEPIGTIVALLGLPWSLHGFLAAYEYAEIAQ